MGNDDKSFLDLEDLKVYLKLCDLHLEVCERSHEWPSDERFELGSQVRRSSNSSPAQLAEKNDDRHLRNKIEGVNRSRGEAGETLHHLFMAHRKNYITAETYQCFRERYKECIRMLNGLERSLEQYLPESARRWTLRETSPDLPEPTCPRGWPPSEPID